MATWYEKSFRDLNIAVDRMRMRFQAWTRVQAFGPAISKDTLCCMQLAVHEWIANLEQHAEFGARAPEVKVRLWTEGRNLQCLIADNSEGFDFSARIGDQLEGEAGEDLIERMPERGIGLVLLVASTEEAKYRHLGEHQHQLQLSARGDRTSAAWGAAAPGKQVA